MSHLCGWWNRVGDKCLELGPFILQPHPWHGWNRRGAFPAAPPTTPVLGEVTSSMDPSVHGWIQGLIPSFGLFILAVQETAFVRVVSSWEQCPHGSCSWASASHSCLCWENPQREEINNPREGKEWIGRTVRATAHHPTPSPVPPTCVMVSCFLEASCL